MIRKRKTKNEKKKFTKLIVSGCIFGFFGLLVVGSVYIAILIQTLPSPEQFNVQRVSQSTKIYDRKGEVVLYEIHGEEKRTVVPFEQIPDVVKKATLAAEDADFYNQPAFDWKGILRALYANIRQGKTAQGGSTITQQLAKNVFLSPEKTITRKVKELILALELESKYSKEEIFYFYLNQIPYGSNAYGVEAATQSYFGKSVRDISLEEAAILAAMLKAPSYFSPWGSHTSDLLDRKNYVLDRMAELGFIEKQEAEKAKMREIKFSPPSLGSIKAPHFALMVKEYLVNKYGEELVNNGGLKVISTIDWDMQQMAETSVLEGSKNNEKIYGSRNAALVAEDPKTGQILALVGSRNYFDIKNDGNFNVATQGLRQPGSALKPFVYLTAFHEGYSPKTTIFDVSTEFDVRNTPETSYRPINFDGKTRGPVALENALAQSLNIPAVKLLYLAGINNSLKTLHDFGISTLRETWRYGLSLVLGGGEVKLVDLVNTYGTLSQEGVKHDQVIVLRVEDPEGNVLEKYSDNAKRVFDDTQSIRLVTKILSTPELRAPIFGNSLPLTVFDGYDVALKTGTSDDHKDAWTIGYTPSLVVGVWAGNNDNTAMIRQGSSILAAVPIWNSFLKEAIKKYDKEQFTKPEPVPYTAKPMMNGEYIWKPLVQGKTYPQIHSILYYVDKENPLGPRPENPQNDPQFQNWETAVINWAQVNIPESYTWNQPISGDVSFSDQHGTINKNELGQVVNEKTTITLLSPKNGEFLSSPFVIQANINAGKNKELRRVELSINDRLINGFDIEGTFYGYYYYFNTPLDPQNLLEIKVTDSSGSVTQSSFILYKK